MVIVKLLERLPLLGWSVAPMLVSKISGARDSFLCGEACSHLAGLVQQKSALGAAAGRLLRILPELQVQLLALLTRDGLKSKHLAPPLRFAYVVLRALQNGQQQQVAAELAYALSPVVAAITAKQALNARS